MKPANPAESEEVCEAEYRFVILMSFSISASYPQESLVRKQLTVVWMKQLLSVNCSFNLDSGVKKRSDRMCQCDTCLRVRAGTRVVIRSR